MDYKLVYLRTPAGVEAAAQRTRIVQRNLRNVLGLVDGKRTVEEIIKKFGDAGIAEAALADLERSGFIETPEGRRLRKASPETEAASPAPSLQPPPAPASKPPKAFSGDFDDEDITVMDPLDFPDSVPPPSVPPPSAPKSASAVIDDELAELASGKIPPLPSRPVFADDDGDALGPSYGLDVAKRRRKRPWAKYVAFGLVGLIAAAVGVVLLFPYDRYLPRVELKIRGAILDPVRIQRLSPTFLPNAGFALDQVAIGADQLLTVRRITVAPAWLSFLSSPIVVRLAVLDSPEFDVRAIPQLIDWLSGGMGSERYFVAERIRFDRARIRFGSYVVEGVGGEIVLDERGKLVSIRFVNGDGNVSGDLVPEGKSFRVKLNASQWKVPTQEWIELTTLDATGTLSATGLSLQKFDARALGGVVAGTLALDWAQGAVLQAGVDLKRVQAEQLVRNSKPDLRIKGELSGSLSLKSTAGNIEGIARGISAEGAIEIERGILANFDFGEAVRTRRGAPIRGGETRFERLTAGVKAGEGSWVIRDLEFSAGVMRAQGSAQLEGGGVAGSVQVGFGGASDVRATVILDGPLKDPQLVARR